MCFPIALKIKLKVRTFHVKMQFKYSLKESHVIVVPKKLDIKITRMSKAQIQS